MNTKEKYFAKFLWASFIIGAISVIWNLIFQFSWTLIWINLVEKVFIFDMIGLVLVYVSPEIIELKGLKSNAIIAVLIAIVPTILETIAGTLDGTFLGTLFVRVFGAAVGLWILNFFWEGK